MDLTLVGIYSLPLIIGALAYVRSALDLLGSITGLALAYILIYIGLPWFSLILDFFVIGTIVTRIGYERKKKLGQHQKTRGILNVLGNSLVGVGFALIGNAAGASSAFCSATSDTSSSEIGLLSKTRPRSILTGKEVPPGYDGGVTPLGLAAMIGTSFIFSLVPLYFWGWRIFIISFVSGIIGAIADSILGDAFESRKIWGNNTTNFVSTLIAGIIGYLLALVL